METDEGYLFFYYEDYISAPDAVAASQTLPLQKEAYVSNVLFPFFDGIIPEVLKTEDWIFQSFLCAWFFHLS